MIAKLSKWGFEQSMITGMVLFYKCFLEKSLPSEPFKLTLATAQSMEI